MIQKIFAKINFYHISFWGVIIGYMLLLVLLVVDFIALLCNGLSCDVTPNFTLWFSFTVLIAIPTAIFALFFFSQGSQYDWEETRVRWLHD